jgi:hypothetical protein
MRWLPDEYGSRDVALTELRNEELLAALHNVEHISMRRFSVPLITTECRPYFAL